MIRYCVGCDSLSISPIPGGVLIFGLRIGMPQQDGGLDTTRLLNKLLFRMQTIMVNPLSVVFGSPTVKCLRNEYCLGQYPFLESVSTDPWQERFHLVHIDRDEQGSNLMLHALVRSPDGPTDDG